MCIRNNTFKTNTIGCKFKSRFLTSHQALKSQGINFSDNTDNVIYVHSASATPTTDNNKEYFPALNEIKSYYTTHN